MRVFLKVSFLLVTFAAAPQVAISDGDPMGIEYTVPTTSNLKVEVSSAFYVKFLGETKIKARYKFECDEYSDENLTLLLFPNQSSLPFMPAFKDRGRNKEITEIYIKNPTEIAIEILSAELVEKIKNGNIQFLTGEAEFILSNIAATYECDQLGFISRNINLSQIVKNHINANINSSKSCQ
jgi:hypothetical protein